MKSRKQLEKQKDKRSPVHRLLDLADQEAHSRMNDPVGIEHILLAALKMSGVSEATFAKAFGVDIKELETTISKKYTEGICDLPIASRPYTQEAQALLFAFKLLKDSSTEYTTTVLMFFLAHVLVVKPS